MQHIFLSLQLRALGESPNNLVYCLMEVWGRVKRSASVIAHPFGICGYVLCCPKRAGLPNGSLQLCHFMVQNDQWCPKAWHKWSSLYTDYGLEYELLYGLCFMNTDAHTCHTETPYIINYQVTV